MESITHIVDGQEYEIRSGVNQNTQQQVVSIYLDGHKIHECDVSIETASDFAPATGETALEALIAIAKSELDAGIAYPRSRVSYRGYVIQARPQQLVENEHWTTDITIQRDAGEATIVRPFSAASTFASRREAVTHCINFGCRIIDGEVVGCTAP